MEGFNEQIVKRENKAKQLIIKIISVAVLCMIPVIGAVLGLNINLYIFTVSIFIFAFGIYAVWYIFTSQNVEYEYSTAGDELEVSKVMSKRRRKLVTKVKLREVDAFGKGEETIDGISIKKTFFAAADIDDDKNNYFLVYTSPAFGKCLLVFNPDENILRGMRPYLKRDIVQKLFY